MNTALKSMLNDARITSREYGVYVFFDFNDTRRLGRAVIINRYTTWVELKMGARGFKLIKRHNFKHNITPHWDLKDSGWDRRLLQDEAIHTTVRYPSQTS